MSEAFALGFLTISIMASFIGLIWFVIWICSRITQTDLDPVDLCRLGVGETFIFKDEPRTVFIVLCQEHSSEGRKIHALNCKTGKNEICDCFAQVYRVNVKFKTWYKLAQPKKPIYHYVQA